MMVSEMVLSGLVIAFVSAWLGNFVGKRSKVSDKECEDHRHSCSKLVCQKIDALSKRVDELKKAVDGKLLGL